MRKNHNFDEQEEAGASILLALVGVSATAFIFGVVLATVVFSLWK